MVSTGAGKANFSHEERTASEPRHSDLHPVILENISVVNERIKTFKFTAKNKDGVKFLPGQWLDVHIPGLSKAGGFTITSSPRHALPTTQNSISASKPFLELAVQKSPSNPSAAWLWQPPSQILGHELSVRVGGSFVWPPPAIARNSIKRVVFVAGGVGINPLISMLSSIREEERAQGEELEVHMLYSTKLPFKNPEQGNILFLPRILDLFRTHPKDRLGLFFTGTWTGELINDNDDFVKSFAHQDGSLDREKSVTVSTRRITEADLLQVIEKQDKRGRSVFYVCGPPAMTDGIVEFLRQQEGIPPDRVLCEKWW